MYRYIILAILVISLAGCGGRRITGKDGVSVVTGKDGAPMALIPAGEFQMGSNDGTYDERPVHTVYLDAFYMDKYEVTNALYKKFMDATGHKAPADWCWNDNKYNAPDQPVVGVTWDDAVAYAEFYGKRLPTEAEWEKAARGGLVGKKFPWGDADLDGSQCNSADRNYNSSWSDVDDSHQYTAPVGSYTPNGYGLYDMAGNIYEWCSDWYSEDYYSVSPQRNPTGPGSGTARVTRDGLWFIGISGVRVADRFNNNPTNMNNYNGFRCVSQD